MKKALSVILAMAVIVSCIALSGCSKKAEKGYDIVMITDGAAINDGAENESAWNGVKSYGEEKNMTYRYYQPSLDEDGKLSVDTIKNYIDLAAKDNAKFIILPGEDFAVSAYEVAPAYGDINFILVDAFPHAENDKTVRFQSNVMCVSYNALQAGFLAGYSAVADGFTKLGYLGSVNADKSGNYGAGFVQGAAFAADRKQIPVLVDYANYDAVNLDYDYSVNVKATYKKVSEEKDKTFKVNVVDGLGSGVYKNGENVTITASPAPEGKIFDHWETKSDTKGVRDGKVNISSKKDSSMNLLVGGCDCTIKAVWADCETAAVQIVQPGTSLLTSDSDTAPSVDVETFYAPVNSDYYVEAPAAPLGYVFDKWVCSKENAIENPNEANTTVKVEKDMLLLNPQYKPSDIPTFQLTVENGTGSGVYVAGAKVKTVANAPEEGYMFEKWESVDNQGLATGISMENEYCYATEFEMVDRVASVAERMFDGGAQVVFGGGNPISDSIFSATNSFDYQVWAFGSGIDESSKGNCLASVVNDYGQAIKLALDEYQPGGIMSAGCENGCIYVTGKSLEKTKKDKKGNDVENDEYSDDYAMIYNALAEGKYTPTMMESGGDVRNTVKSSCLSVNYWVKE